MIRCLPPIAALVLLTACGDGDNANDKRVSSGEVLEGTISDEMIPLDSVTSTAPADTGAADEGDGGTTAKKPADNAKPDVSTPKPGFSE